MTHLEVSTFDNLDVRVSQIVTHIEQYIHGSKFNEQEKFQSLVKKQYVGELHFRVKGSNVKPLTQNVRHFKSWTRIFKKRQVSVSNF